MGQPEYLPLREDSSDVKLKTLDQICKRIIASVLSIQLACDICEGNDYEEAKGYMQPYLDFFKVKDSLFDNEQELFNSQIDQHSALQIVWDYEAVWSLLWALSFVEDMDKPFNTCDTEKVISIVVDCGSVEDFKSKAKLRDIEEILDMLDLYYRYHWAVVEKRINPDTPIGQLYPDVVWERRKGLEWLFSDEEDWNLISLDT